MGEVNVNQVDSSFLRLQKIKETKQQYKNPKVNVITKRSRTYNCKCIAPVWQSMALVKEEAKQDRGSSEIREILSHLLGNSSPNQRMNCSITGNHLTALLSMLVIV